tara:strand:- start:274 stop:567 length:294 start_codon:yes stop_codon:yes gene_type:complete
MTKLEELKAAYEAAHAHVSVAEVTYTEAVYKLDVVGDSAALEAKFASDVAWHLAWTASDVAWAACQAELKETQEEDDFCGYCKGSIEENLMHCPICD